MEPPKPHFRYCNIVSGRCDETRNQTQLNKLQQLQNRAARAAAKAQFKNTDHAKLFQDLGWLNIEQLIAYYTAVMMYKVQKDIVPDEAIELFQSVRITHTYNTRPLILKISSYTHKALGKSQFHMKVDLE